MTLAAVPPPAGQLRLARLAWLLFLAVGLVVLAASLPLHWAQWSVPCLPADCRVGQLTAPQAQQLPALGLSLAAWATFLSVFWHVQPFAALAIAGLIFWRRSDDPMALFTSFVLVASSLGGIADYASPWPALQALENFYAVAGEISVALLLLVFPDGHFRPRWTRWLVPLPFVAEALSAFLPLRTGIVNLAIAAVWLLFLLLLLYRYRRVFNARQRLQTKWVVYLNALALLGLGLGGYVIALVFPLDTLSPLAGLALYAVTMVALLAFPVSIAIAVLRARLWDIDLIIRRTLIYGVLTALLAAVYFASVLALQALFVAFTGQQRSELVTVLSTLAIAALFVPLRRRLQAAIDQRFYRRKYDTARTLAGFSVHVRQHVDLDRLAAELLAVVQDTVEPAQVSLSLISPHRR